MQKDNKLDSHAITIYRAHLKGTTEMYFPSKETPAIKQLMEENFMYNEFKIDVSKWQNKVNYLKINIVKV